MGQTSHKSCAGKIVQVHIQRENILSETVHKILLLLPVLTDLSVIGRSTLVSADGAHFITSIHFVQVPHRQHCVW